MSALYDLVERLDSTIQFARDRAAELPRNEEVDIAVTDLQRARETLVALEGRLAGQS